MAATVPKTLTLLARFKCYWLEARKKSSNHTHHSLCSLFIASKHGVRKHGVRASTYYKIEIIINSLGLCVCRRCQNIYEWNMLLASGYELILKWFSISILYVCFFLLFLLVVLVVALLPRHSCTLCSCCAVFTLNMRNDEKKI